MLIIKPAPYERLLELCAADGVTAAFCCEASDGDQRLGHVLFQNEGGCLVFVAARCPDPLLDGLLRAALNAGELAGMSRFRFSPDCKGEHAGALVRLGYPGEGDIARFFAQGCKGTRA